MEEIERPKTPRRRRAASTDVDANPADGTAPAKPARRRAVSKPGDEAAPAVPKPARAPAKPRAPRATAKPAVPDGTVHSDAAQPTPARKPAARSRKPAAATVDTTPARVEAEALASAIVPDAESTQASAPAAVPASSPPSIASPSPASSPPAMASPPLASSSTPVASASPASNPPPAASAPATATGRAPASPVPAPAAAPRPPAAAARTPEHEPAAREAAARASARDAAAESAPAKIPSFARKPEPPRPPPAAAARPADTARRPGQVLDWLLARLPQRHRARAHDYLVLMRMDRPIGALLLLWPTWWALWFAANDFPPLGTLLIFTLGVFVMRAAGCVINDYADHGWLDAKVERTAGRPMAAGRVSKKEALILFGGLLALAFVLVLFTNALTIQLSFVGAALAAIYPFTKRVTHLAQVVLGAAFGWSIPMAFAAVTNSLPPLAWLLFLANVLFSTIYDTEYAMVDRDEDIRAGSKSTAILFGDADRAILGVLMATFVLAMLLAGTRAQLAWPYFVGLAATIGLFGYQQWLIRARERMACFAAFRHNNWVGLALWVGLAMALAMR